MKTRTYILTLVAVLFFVGALLWRRPTAHITVPLANPPATPIENRLVAGAATPPPKPAKFYQFNHQPTNPEEKAMWDWWFYMDKHDPQFQWRTPLNFYGRVIDQNAQPVANARVGLAWNDIKGSHEKNIESGNDGRFELKDVIGKVLSVQVGKNGYAGAASSTKRGFEYSAFWDQDFYLADKENPVLFRLWKLEDAEPMYFWDKLKKLTVDGQKVWFDTKTGRLGASGDVAFSTKRGATYAPRQFDWSLSIEAAPGGGLALSKEELMFEAPEGGYEPSWTQDIGGKDASYAISKSVNFYLKTPDGKYAAIKTEIGHMTIPEGEVNLSAYVNPSGSRNLQFDAKKRIVPK